MKWKDLETLSEKFDVTVRDTVRHDYGRKCDQWTQARGTVTLTQAVVDALGTYEIPKGTGPFDDLPEEFAGGIFVANNCASGRKYLVNTEGFDYSRYIANLKIVD
jgi:hypothetical protein